MQWASVLDLAWAEEREGEGRGREEREDRKTRGNAGEADAELQPCPWLVVLTRQVFFPFLFFLPISLARGPSGARPQVPGWHGWAAGVGATWAPVQLSQHHLGLGLGAGLGTWSWPDHITR